MAAVITTSTIGAVLVTLLAACGPGLASRAERDDTAGPLVEAFGDPVKLRALLHTSVVNAGLLFDDPSCTQKFAAPGQVSATKLDDFAACLAQLKLEGGTRRSALRGVSVLSYTGLEVEARVEQTSAGASLTWIGFVGNHDLRGATPTITAHELEGLRVAGDARGPVLEGNAWLRLCLDAQGAVTSAVPVQTSSAGSYAAFASSVSEWRFRPFAFQGHPMPACAFVHLSQHAEDVQILPMSLFAPRDHVVIEIAGLGTRVSGTDVVVPNAQTSAEIDRVKVAPLDVSVRFCLDRTGTVVASALAQSGGNRAWDAQMVELVRSWRYAPLVLDGQPTEVCSYATLVYVSSLSGSRDHH